AFADQALSGAGDDTMLMFVGESRPVVTVASRSPEDATTAPTMVTVIDHDEIVRRGYQTLAELLSDQPGFFVATGGRGSVPYLRGLRDSILFLYDGVPMTTDITKEFSPLDREISLAFIKRVEIARGPGSVLWGPDAFAGVVNLVPMAGSLQPLEGTLGAQLGSDQLLGAHLSLTGGQGKWVGFFGANAVRERFSEPDYVEENGFESLDDKVDPSEYLELVGTLDYDNWLHISGRWSDFTSRGTFRDATELDVWKGEKKTPVNQLKLSASKVFGPSHYALSAYFQETDYELLDVDFERRQRNRVYNLEFLWDRRVLERGLLTLGTSWRRTDVDDALVEDGFLPQFPPIFKPRIQQEDYTNDLTSLFGQFRYKLGASEVWAGARLDDHSEYSSRVSYSLGFYRPLTEDFHFKATYGTAYRSPYAKQLFEGVDFDLESIRTASAQLTWQPDSDRLFEVTFYHSRLKDHRVENRYIDGGLSEATDRELYGLEMSGRIPLTENVSLNGNISLVDGNSDTENYESEFCFSINPGEVTCYVIAWDEPVDQGPSWLANLALQWRIGEGHTLEVGASLADRFDYSYKMGEFEGDYSQPPLVDLTYRRPGFFDDDTLTLRFTNLFDRSYRQPDIFGPVKGPPLQAVLLWERSF
ncbi:MAG: TonB-dependent receptor plug domain-containing protein, partial [Desulfuromonadales bacterium]|nr:TonB-dependent receptor plug domain-containing protein [Desulfuromonadales bacterium]